MGTLSYNSPEKILVFNKFKRLIAICSSIHTTALLTGISAQCISSVCSGKHIASGGYYFRYVHPYFPVDNKDLGKLYVEEYDLKSWGKRPLYPTSDMSRKGTHYNKHNHGTEK